MTSTFYLVNFGKNSRVTESQSLTNINIMMKKLLLLSILIVTFNSQSQKNNKISKDKLAMAEVWLEAMTAYDQLPGLTVSVVDDQEIVWSNSFGMANPDEGLEAETSTIFSICSISKLFTAVSIMKLYDEGKLRLDDEVADLLPWFDLKQAYPGSGPVTVENLLTHSSGLPREANFAYWTGPDFPFPEQENIREELKNQETLYPSSTYFQYSNLGLTLLGEIVEEVSGVPFEQYVSDHILKPLRLENTRPELPEELYGKQLAVGYGSEMRDGKREKLKFFQANGIAPAAGFSSTVMDLASFASWQFRLLESDAEEIIKPSTLKNMHNVHWMDPDFDTSWGLGFAVYKGSDGNKWVSHGGSCPGYRSVLQLNPTEKRAYVVMINANGTNPGKYSSALDKILGMSPKKAKFDTEELEKPESDFTGVFNQQPWWSESYGGFIDGTLFVLPLPSEDPSKAISFYAYTGDVTFTRIRDNGEPAEKLIFERNDKGEVYRLKSHNNYSEKMKN